MRDATLVWFAAVVAACGLALLLVAAPAPDTPLQLEGTVVAVRGSRAVLQTNVTLVGRGLRVGESFQGNVFWSDDHFVALRPTSQ